MSTAEVISVIKDIVLSAAAATTAVVAYRGITRWQEELRGNASFDTARSLIRSAYKLRDEIESCRSPFIPASEFPEGYNPISDNSPEKKGDAYAHIYSKRWDPVSKSIQEFDANVLEAEALWGSEVKNKAKPLRICVRELRSAIEAVVQNEYSGGEDFNDREFRKEIVSKVSAVRKDDNQFTTKISSAIEEIEQLVRPHLGRT